MMRWIKFEGGLTHLRLKRWVLHETKCKYLFIEAARPKYSAIRWENLNEIATLSLNSFDFVPAPCGINEFRCHTGFVCVGKKQVCDEHHQCIDGSDDYKSGKFYFIII